MVPMTRKVRRTGPVAEPASGPAAPTRRASRVKHKSRRKAGLVLPGPIAAGQTLTDHRPQAAGKRARTPRGDPPQQRP